MKLSVIGTGYVGLVVGASFANLGNDVVCADINYKKIYELQKNKIPIYEAGLEDFIIRNQKEKRLVFTSDIKIAIHHAEVIFIAVGTPPGKGYEADLTAVQNVAKEIGKSMTHYIVIVNKSTVPVGTAALVKKIVRENQRKAIDFDVVSNPEFLREGMAVRDFNAPDRIIVGVESERAKKIMLALYNPIERVSRPVMLTDIKSAEMIKYASNSMLATRISFMNELSLLCDKVGADIKEVAKGMGLDTRIGPRFLQAGVGFGGSCFPKDVKALIHTMRLNKCEPLILDSVDKVNEKQKRKQIKKLFEKLDVKGKTITVLGLAFKPKTDDIREAPSLFIIKELLRYGAVVNVYDPIAMAHARKMLKDVNFCKNPYEALEGSSALVLVTEWDEFRQLDWKKVKKLMKKHIILDGRNIYEPSEMRQLGFDYMGVGR